ncbi:MAG: endo-1,4-beta-xylanase [Dehalococcoidia bacterium]
MQHFRDAGVPVDKAELEDNLWIYRVPPREPIASTLRIIQDMGYHIAANETTVNVYTADPFWTNRKTSIPVADPLAAQAQVYADTLRAYLDVGAEFGIGGLSDATGWLANVGHPETRAMIFDEQFQPKPAYYALVDVLRQAAGL